MSEICYEPSQIFQPSGARAAPSWLGPPIRLLRSCPVFDALGVGREALRLGVGWLWCGGLHGSRCRRCRACCGFGPWQSGDAPVDYVDDSHVHVAAAGRVVDRDDAVQTIRERLPSFVVVRAAARFFHYRSGLHEPFGAGVALLFGLRPNSGRSTHGRRNRPRGADTAARTAFRRFAHDVRGCARHRRTPGTKRDRRPPPDGRAPDPRRTAPTSSTRCPSP